jgi:hypothetical protein
MRGSATFDVEFTIQISVEQVLRLVTVLFASVCRCAVT